MHNLWNETGMFKSEEQHLACQNRSFLKNNRVTEIEIQQLQREIKKDEIAPEIVDTVSEMSYEGSSRTETVREQGGDSNNYPGGTPEDHFKTPIQV